MALRPLRATSIPKEAVEEEIEYKWYIINTYTSMENRVKKNIEIRAKNLDLITKVVQVLVPTEESVIMIGGRRQTQREKLYPGYLLVYMQLDNETYDCIKGTTGVASFVSTVDNPWVKEIDKYVPTTLTDEEIDAVELKEVA